MSFRSLILTVLFLTLRSFTAQAESPALLFHASGDTPGDGFSADYANGDPEPAYLNEYTIIPGGARGKAFSAPHSEAKLMTYLAPGNIYAQRGTVSFYWRSRDPVAEMPHKLFYVSYCDHASLDMTWLRIDYNGERGFDAFVTDANMARVRVSHKPLTFPQPGEWTHIAFSWDETKGVWLYLDGRLAAAADTTSIFDAGLGLFQPFGRFATPGTVTSNCGHLRGGDIDEITIYGCMLSDSDIGKIASGGKPVQTTLPVRSLDNPQYRSEWLSRYGWDRPDELPITLEGTTHSVRKVEIHDVCDQKKWGWRANDGIRETTWPDVYNRSKLPGRSDYFIEPDWYCYSTSGKSISFSMPEEPWNYVEMTGAAYGTVTHVMLDNESQVSRDQNLFRREQGRERTFHMTAEHHGGRIRFDNDVRETPLAEFSVYNISNDTEPEGRVKLEYVVTSGDSHGNLSLDELKSYIEKRYPPDEREIMTAMPRRAPRAKTAAGVENPLPVVHILIPFQFRDEGPRTSSGAYGGFHYTWDNIDGGLDGIAIDLPPLDGANAINGLIPLNIRVRDPLWPNRAMMDISVSVRPGEGKTLWLDTRDRIMPIDRSLCITIAGPGGNFGRDDLEGAVIRLIFKDRDKAVAEHEIDRFTQMRDTFAANLSETFPQRTKLEFQVRYTRDMHDLFRVNPTHMPGRSYWSRWNPEQGLPPYTQTEAPRGIPLWAFRQSELLKQWRYYMNWWIVNRQIENGEFGGGLSDDGDFANCMPPLALMGIEEEMITDSLHRLMEAYYENGMFTNGLNTIFTDALHTTEEGPNVQSELMLLEYGDPKIVERIMETSRRMSDVTGINDSGHRHFPSRFFSSTKFATEDPFCWSSPYSFFILAPAMTLVQFNGNPTMKKLMSEVGDGLLAHAQKDDKGNILIPRETNFLTDESRNYTSGTAAQLFRALYRWTDAKKFDPYKAMTSRKQPPKNVNKESLAASYEGIIHYNDSMMYIATEGFPWDDSPYIRYSSTVTDRLGGMPVRRGNQYAEHFVSWEFDGQDSGEDVAILVPGPSETSLKIIAFNLKRDAVDATLVGANIEPGTWEITEGIDTNGDDMPDGDVTKRTVRFERSVGTAITFPARKTLIVQMKLKKKGVHYWKRPEIGIGVDDVKIQGGAITVTVHNLGSIDSDETTLALMDGNGNVISKTTVPSIKAPLDLMPKTVDVRLETKRNDVSGLIVVLDPESEMMEITKANNGVVLP